ncbi:unnamed protein product [Phyllotreta striolata]|uniref:Fatty acyl-CoA reductase n=1 Tax=Phyllotreta striolata TaxID=444603 RepID=A0A9N9XT89_PHYSR|nr:unnamed protein product [Phyllotreta striolata]
MMFRTNRENVSIPKFFEKKNVLLTGATGFIGRVLVEKLLRSCPDVNTIYVLLRPKKGKCVQERIKDIVDIPIFDRLRKENPKALEKIVALSGNVEAEGLGLSEEDRKTIIENVNIIFHNAASVRFDDHLKKAVFANTRSAREMVMLARRVKKIEVLTYTSTAYANCNKLTIDEKLYPPQIQWEDLIRIAEEGDELLLEKLTQKFIGDMPNTYTFTKGVAEHAVADLCKGKFPSVIVRPTIVQPSFSDPIPGWADNLNGPVGIMYGVGRGVTRAIYGDINVVYDYAFVDSVVKALIISSWKAALARDVENISIYNIAADLNYPLRDLVRIGLYYKDVNPLKQCLWPANPQIYSNYHLFFLMTLIKHFLPAILIDTTLKILQRKPLLYTIQRKALISNTCLIYFMRNSWTFLHTNYHVLIKCILPEDAEQFSITHYGSNPSEKIKNDFLFNTYLKGLRKYVAKDPDASEADIIKQKWLIRISNAWKFMWKMVALYYLIQLLVYTMEKVFADA